MYVEEQIKTAAKLISLVFVIIGSLFLYFMIMDVLDVAEAIDIVVDYYGTIPIAVQLEAYWLFAIKDNIGMVVGMYIIAGVIIIVSNIIIKNMRELIVKQ